MFLLWIRQLPHCEDWTPASDPPPAKGRSSPTNTPVFPPSSLSHQVLCGSIYSFPLVRSSCPLSAGVLHALLSLKVYSLCMHGERCTPCPPTPPLSFSPLKFPFYLSQMKIVQLLSSWVRPGIYQSKLMLPSGNACFEKQKIKFSKFKLYHGLYLWYLCLHNARRLI